MIFSRLHIIFFLALAAFIWGIALWVKGIPLEWEHLLPFGTVVSVLVLFGIFFEHKLWRSSWLHGWFVERPDLCGTWRVELQSNGKNPDTGEGVQVIVCYMGVEQTLSTFQMHLMTPESESWFVAERINKSPSENGYQVVGVYSNTPKIELRGVRSEIHRGALILDTHGPAGQPDALTGEYWTDRGTSGRMNFTARISKTYTRYEDSRNAFTLTEKSDK